LVANVFRGIEIELLAGVTELGQPIALAEARS
jgi:hypothetical protein